MSAVADKLWLIRRWVPAGGDSTARKIVGPLSRDEIQNRLLAGELDPEDEICLENHYWVSLYETDEWMRYFSVRSEFVKEFLKGRLNNPDDETTVTELDEGETVPELERFEAPDITKMVVRKSAPLTMSSVSLEGAKHPQKPMPGPAVPQGQQQSRMNREKSRAREKLLNVFLFFSIVMAGLVVRYLLQTLR